MILTTEEQIKLEEIRKEARIRHHKAKNAAYARGRKDFPLLPFECSWAYEQEFMRKIRN